MGEWRPIDSAPKDGREIDLWGISKDYEGRYPECKWERVGRREDERYAWTCQGYGISTAADPVLLTHWRELPDAPPGHQWRCSEEDNAALAK